MRYFVHADTNAIDLFAGDLWNDRKAAEFDFFFSISHISNEWKELNIDLEVYWATINTFFFSTFSPCG